MIIVWKTDNDEKTSGFLKEHFVKFQKIQNYLSRGKGKSLEFPNFPFTMLSDFVNNFKNVNTNNALNYIWHFIASFPKFKHHLLNAINWSIDE